MDELERKMDRLHKELGLGATGDFPEGKLRPDDEGGLRLAVGIQDGQVLISFGDTPLRWIAMRPPQALQLAASLQKFALLLQDAPCGGPPCPP